MLNFEKIELLGFKSFADKVEIDLLDGITAIVGPNGCGKSNVADAIRWVLGEQSAKTLRGTSMQDVIFNGTQSRKSLSYCEVSLYFNNTEKIFPSLEFSEVVMTRKIYRNGDSEYFMNRRPCRMKDIVDTLHECGVSKDGYTIIGQGKVSEILSSKPEDRRAIFEEAVGIAKTKRDRKETINKLQRTSDNIARVDDILTEKEGPLERLRKQSETTRAFRALSEDLKYHEVNAYIYKYETANDTRRKISDKIQGYQEEIVATKREFEKTLKEYENHQQEVNSLDEKIKYLNEKITEKAVDIANQEGENKLSSERISFFKSQNERISKETALGNEKIAQNKKMLQDKNARKKDCDNQIALLSKKANALGQEIAKITAEINVGEDIEQSVQTQVLKSVENLADIKKNLGALSSEENVITERQKGVVEKVNALVDRYGAISLELDLKKQELSLAEKEFNDISDEIKELSTDIQATNEFISKIENDIYNVNVRFIRNEAQLKAKMEIKNSMEGFNYAVKNLIKASQSNSEVAKRFKGAVASVITTDKKYEEAINTAIGGAMQSVVTDSDTDAKFLIEYLKANSLGRATFLPVKTIRTRPNGSEIISALKENNVIGLATDLVKYDAYYENVVNHLLGGTLVVENLDSAISISRKYPYAFKIVTLDGEIIAQVGSITGGDNNKSRINLLSVDRVIEDYKLAVEKDGKELVRLQESKEQFLNEVNEKVLRLDTLKHLLTENRQKQVLVKEHLNFNQKTLEEIESEIEKNKDEIALISTRLAQIKSEFADYSLGDEKLKKEKEDASKEQSKRREEFIELRAKRDAMLSENTSVQAKISALMSEIASSESEIERLSGEILEIEHTISHNEEVTKQNEEVILKLTREFEKSALSEDEQLSLASLRRELEEIDVRKAKLSELIQQDNLKRGALQEDIDRTVAKKGEEEIALAKVGSDLEYMSQNVFEAYQLTYDTCLPFKDEKYDISLSNQDVKEIKRKISSLGSVNPSAIEEYAEASESYNTLLVQRDDLVKAQEDLQKVINDLTKEMTLTFNEGFKTIRSNFGKIFKELFGGGSADLIIEESQTGDPLDAGIEIVAEPPGKKLQKISLLSGGEMSLTAIAILFAILRLRPMPFCVLDEIEAALDDANVARFAKYLKNFAKETQFICITHKKVTMEYADGLFGVTMPEKGVSSIVSVKLSDVTDKGELKN